MSTNGCDPWVEFQPGDLIAANIINDLQCQIRDEIGVQSQAAVDAITAVAYAEDAGKLEGQSLDELRQAIIEQAIGAMAQHSGYMRLYKKLMVGEENVIEHGLQNSPLVDLYQLDYFLVIASEDDYVFPTWVNFYLYHSSEKRIRYRPEGENVSPVSVEIEPTGGQAYRIPFKEMLARFNVEFTESSTMADVETEFWDAIFAAPNDVFSDDQYTHSPWFDRCCREERTVKNLKQRGDWDDLWIKVMPRKMVNYEPPADDNRPQQTAPANVRVSHFDWNRTGLTLMQALTTPPVHLTQVFTEAELRLLVGFAEEFPEWQQELKLMVLLRA